MLVFKLLLLLAGAFGTILAVLEVAEDSLGNRFRLAGGRDCSEGRVEVFHDGQWGSICGGIWGDNEGDVVCRMLGFDGAKSVIRKSREFGSIRASAPIWFDHIRCKGHEASLFDCYFWTPGYQGCNPRTDAGVRCRAPAIQKVPTLPLRVYCNGVCENCTGCGKKYISDQTSCENDVQVKGFLQAKYRGRWRFVDGTHYTDDLAYVACGMLGYPTNFAAPSYNELLCCNDTNSENCMSANMLQEINSPLMIDLKCDGSERDLQSCSFISWSGKHYSCGHQPGKVVTISCGFAPGQYCPTQKLRPIRLASTPYPGEGRVEVLMGGHWGTICGRGMSVVDADVLCRHLGFGFSRKLFTQQSGYFGVGSPAIKNVHCPGKVVKGSVRRISDIDGCKYSTATTRDCTHNHDVSIVCQLPEKCDEPTVKLLPFKRRTSSSYYVEANVDGVLGLICSTGGLVSRAEGEVMCRTGTANEEERKFFEGFRAVDPTRYHGSNRFIGRLNCSGTEVNSNECNMTLIKMRNCSNGKVLAVDCARDLPDLVLDVTRLAQSLSNRYLTPTSADHLACAFEEKCLPSRENGPFIRYLLRFDSLVMNRGRKDFVPYLSRSEWDWHECHKHFHSHLGFATYELLDQTDRSVVQGHKASFCLEDSWYDTSLRAIPYYQCSVTQGISVGCGDLYGARLDCQWLDVSLVPDGKYTLRVHVNPFHNPPESDYTNNVAECSIILSQRSEFRLSTVESCRIV